MSRNIYRPGVRRQKRNGRKLMLLIIILAALGAFAYWKFALPSPVEKAVSNLEFDSSVSEAEKQVIRDAITNQQITYKGTVDVSVKTVMEPDSTSPIIEAYVPVANYYSTRQNINGEEFAAARLVVPESMEEQPKAGLAESLGADEQTFLSMSADLAELKDDQIALVPAGMISDKVKLLSLNGKYYLDEFSSGAVFRQAVFAGEGSGALAVLDLNDLAGDNQVLKFNQTGVTALTRMMMRKLQSVGTATFFSDNIGPFLADADITHVSNEVSFKEGCTWHNALFCSPPEMIETLKASGVDVVELTGNHNNDVGADYNAETINLYHSLGWSTVGGGLNTEEAAKPYLADKKGTKLALLAYNYPDSPNGGAISGPSKAGANGWDIKRIESDIKAAKDQDQYVIVDIQFWECYSYPDGYVEFPECDSPIPNQTEVFRSMVDLGADMVVGISAHQPQTYEVYKDKPIYYGLGNMYFEQTQWPGTERGIILSHYFIGGKLVQTRLTPTVYDEDFQPEIMNNDDAVWLLNRLRIAREQSL